MGHFSEMPTTQASDRQQSRHTSYNGNSRSQTSIGFQHRNLTQASLDMSNHGQPRLLVSGGDEALEFLELVPD